MSAASGPPAGAPIDFARLGTGGSDDRMSFRVVLHILWRTLPLLRSVRRHLIALAATLLIGLVLGIPVMLIMTDILSTRVLQGRALTIQEAEVLGLDPQVYASENPDAPTTTPDGEAGEPPTVSVEQRKTVRDRWLAAVIILAVLGTPYFVGLVYYGLWILQRINQELRVLLLGRIQGLSLRFHGYTPPPPSAAT